MKVKYFFSAHLFSFIFIHICTLIYFWQNIPNTLSLHSDLNGVKGNEMSKLFLFLFPLINGLLILLFNYISNKPEQWNLPSPPSSETLKNIPRILLFLSYVVSVIFTYFLFSSLITIGVIKLNTLSILFLGSYFVLPYLFFILFGNKGS